MSRNRRREPRRNALKPEVNRLELRWLMSQGPLASNRLAPPPYRSARGEATHGG
jgi:hypothetical protein